MGLLDKNGLLNKKARRYADVELPSGGTARLQSLTELERSEYNSELLDKKGEIDRKKLAFGTAMLLVRMLVDENNKRMFLDNEYEELSGLDSRDMEVLGDAARKHVGFDADSREELKKKSEVTQD